MADEDHDRAEVSNVVALQKDRLIRRRFQFSAPQGTAAGWLEWTDAHQAEAQNLWGQLPAPAEPTLRGHVMALGGALWGRGIKPFSPTRDVDRNGIQGEMERWRALGLEDDLCEQASLLESKGLELILDPRRQSAWFSLDPQTGKRSRLESGQPCPKGHWLSPGAALRPLMQSLLLPVKVVILGPGERAYWLLTENLWERVGLTPPLILPRPSAFVLPDGYFDISTAELEALRQGQWEAFAPNTLPKPSIMPFPGPHESWSATVGKRYQAELCRLQTRLKRLDARLARESAEARIGKNIEKLRQILFPFNKPQERVLPGWCWLQNAHTLDAIERALESEEGVHLITPGSAAPSNSQPKPVYSLIPEVIAKPLETLQASVAVTEK